MTAPCELQISARLPMFTSAAIVFSSGTTRDILRSPFCGSCGRMLVLVCWHRLPNHIPHHIPRYVSQAEVAAVELEREPLVIESEKVQDRGVQVVDADAVFDGLVADVVGRAVGRAPLYAAAGQPIGKGVRVVVAARAPFLH